MENEILDELDKIDALLKHIKNVQENCEFLGKKLIRDDKVHLGRLLIANGLKHDNSKFFGIEWDTIATGDGGDDNLLKEGISQHNRTNAHHPEYWGSIHEMPSIYVAEMVCDWKARSSEFGSDLTDWIVNMSTKRFGYSMDDRVGQEIQYYLGLLLAKKFV